MTHSSDELNQTDLAVERDRGSRMLVGILSPILVFSVGYLLGVGFGSFFKLPNLLGIGAGLGLGALGLYWLIPRLYVTNGAVAAFVTVNMLSKELVTYGPGLHWSFPWEGRDGANNVNLEEVAENYTVKIPLKDGTITVPFSARLRPNIKALALFLAGAGAIAADLGDLISAKIVEFFTKVKTDVGVQQATAMIPDLNNYLKREFVDGESEQFEGRFGVMVGDITAGTIQVSDEVEETLGALTESRLIDRAVAESYGMENIAAVEAAIAAGKIEREDVNRRRTQVMAMSGNLQGMDLKETTTNFRLQGLDKVDPRLLEAVLGIAPALNALLAARGNHQQRGGRRGGNPKGPSQTS